MKMQNVGILGIGSALPDKIVTNVDLEKIVDTNDEWIRTRTGICERRVAAEGEHTSDLAARAAQKALDDAGISVDEVDLIILATATPDSPMPSTACHVQAKIGATRAAAFDLSAVCTGFIYGLAVGSQFVATGVYKRVLVIGAEVLSRILDWSDRSTCVLFGDGAGAVVLGPREAEGLLSFKLGSDGTTANLLHIPAGGTCQPATPQTLEDRLHYVKMSGNEIYKFAVRAMGEVTQEALDAAGVDKKDLDLLVPHQANWRIIEAARKRFDVPEDRVVVNIDRYGNMSSASIPVALDEAYRSGRLNRGDLLALVGFGAGLTWGAAVLRY
ncbi:beta-ketoacyl-ACP synthase III [Dethiobacter alkaliphilus]|uniref:Beta-ketoacyl-[acyl-carrier-protein] synthase III n=1 Tax=Dethiobacter alkaliphilus AHT 1 TaxID=555088 RepID=C0GHK5_DETAL|nr:beta-ketoacyl-ACP synthase III [Dethiobacter alkaliphilus]EEG77211.1 3-oxoacyl-(acyl-carrier-protein) synthase III [Dethiobacter alkaliphilus AHT 1]